MSKLNSRHHKLLQGNWNKTKIFGARMELEVESIFNDFETFEITGTFFLLDFHKNHGKLQTVLYSIFAHIQLLPSNFNFSVTKPIKGVAVEIEGSVDHFNDHIWTQRGRKPQ